MLPCSSPFWTSMVWKYYNTNHWHSFPSTADEMNVGQRGRKEACAVCQEYAFSSFLFFFFFGVFSASMFQTLIITTKSQRHKSVCAFWTYHHLPVVINGQLGIVLLPDDGRRGCSLDAAVEARWASHISSQTSRFLSKVSRNAWK